MDDHIKQALLNRFSAYLDSAAERRDFGSAAERLDPGGAAAAPEPPDDPGEAADLFSVFVEMAGLRSEVRTESRLVKEALDQFRGVFDLLRTSQASLQQELDRVRADTRAQANAALRPLLLDVIDLRDRLVAALNLVGTTRPRWSDRLLRRNAPRNTPGGAEWQEGLRMTLRRLDQVLLDRGVVAAHLVGQTFDPRRARVVATAPDPSVPEGTVIEEVRIGFLWDDQVLRAAEVIVSKGGAAKGDLS